MPDVEVLYIGSKNGPEQKMVERFSVRYEGVQCGKLRRYFSLDNFFDFFKLPVGFFQARSLIKKFSPDVVFSKGGYVSVPVVMAARSLGVAVIVHESDISPGLSNKICFRFADKICLSFEESKSYLSENFRQKAVYSGTPVRKDVFEGDIDAGYKFTGFDRHRPVLLIMGGSQGAQQINELVRASLNELVKRFQIVHLVGKGNLDIGVNKKGYQQYEFLNEELKDVYAISEMVITRGGANSLFELALLGKKVMIIPLGTLSSRGEQVKNAQFFVSHFGWSMISGNVTQKDFIDNIFLTYNNSVNTDQKIKNGLKNIVDLILSYENRS